MAPQELGQYVHNGRGERVFKTVNGMTTLFFYDQTGDIVGEYDQQGNALREHVYGLTGRLATSEGGATYWHHNDHLGTPQKMTDNSATILWNAIYQAFGKAEVNEDPDGDGSTVINNFRFPGQYFDAESGLHYNYFRSYDPDTGRYTQADPIGLGGGLNGFGYVGGNPVNNIDPSGTLAALAAEGGGILLIGAAIHCSLNPEMCTKALHDIAKKIAEMVNENGKGTANPRIPDFPGSNNGEGDGTQSEPWPDSDDWRGQCIRLYDICQNKGWGGNCGACLNKCTSKREWPFEDCSPDKKNKRCK